MKDKRRPPSRNPQPNLGRLNDKRGAVIRDIPSHNGHDGAFASLGIFEAQLSPASIVHPQDQSAGIEGRTESHVESRAQLVVLGLPDESRRAQRTYVGNLAGVDEEIALGLGDSNQATVGSSASALRLHLPSQFERQFGQAYTATGLHERWSQGFGFSQGRRARHVPTRHSLSGGCVQVSVPIDGGAQIRHGHRPGLSFCDRATERLERWRRGALVVTRM